MIHTSTEFWFAVIGVGVVGLLLLAVGSRKYWEEPGGRLYGATTFSIAVMASFSGLWLANDAQQGPSSQVVFAAWFLLPVAWGGFAARRAGVRGVTRERILLVAGFFVGIVVAPPAGEWLLGTLGVELAGVPATAIDVVLQVLRIVATFSSIGIFMVGVGLVIHNAVEYEHISTYLAATLTIAASVAWVGLLSATNLAGGDDPMVAAAVAGVGGSTAVSAAGFWLATSRFGLFERSVAAGSIGREKVVETMEDAVIVVNDEGRTLDLNPVARRLFEVEVEDVVGESAEAAVGAPLEELRTADLLELETLVGVRELEPRASVVTGTGGDLLGFSIVLRDVTERRSREERLAVLNRVLRHNLRNEVSVISGYAELLGDKGATIALDRAATEITETAYELAEIGEKARVIEQIMAEPPMSETDLALTAVVDRAVGRVQDDHPSFDVAGDVPEDLTVAANPNVLLPVVENVVENAVEHNDADERRVEVRATEGVDPSTVTLTVVDNGPGIPDDERAVLQSGDVTPLEHGSGLGLWIAKWGITRLGGKLSFAATEPRGTIVTIRLPVDGPDVDALEVTPGALTRAGS